MVLELHIWGPSFGLPSIDAQCLATIAYMRKVIPRGQWSLVASSDPTLSPTIHGQPLLDLSLYVSSQNYSEITRPIFNTIQSFPLPYLTPPHLRAEAKKRTEYLGLSSLDIDTEDGDKSRESSIIPESLRRGKQTVSSLLAASPETHAQIRLDGLATNFFESIQELKGEKKYLVSNSHMSSLDCLALGFMSLMLYPRLPQPWLAKTMRKKFPDLVGWVEELKDEVWGALVSLDDAMLTKSDNNADVNVNAVERKKINLPWQAPESRGVLNVGGVFLASLADSIPIVGQQRKDNRMRRSGGEETGKNQDLDMDMDTDSRVWRYVATVGSLLAAAGLVAGYALHRGFIQLPENWPGKKVDEDEDEKTRGLGDLGEAGQALFAFADHMDLSAQR
ncbi:hypothetical protein NHQ30_005963 [Ciborinia camelliae]|nr:hypothetical protein NHQ30_005963 [Ciborinia camelliae]